MMNKEYKVLDACNTNSSYAFETIESKMNRVAKSGYRLDRPLQFITEDQGDNAPSIYRIIAIMSRKEKKEKPKKLKMPKADKKPKQANIPELGNIPEESEES